MKIRLQVIAGPHEGRSFEFDGHDTFLVGRGPQAHFRLPVRDNYFSRLHFMVEVNPPQCRLTDLDSTNGTLLNHARVRQADLKNGDIIRGGRTRLRVSLEEDDIRSTRRQAAPSNPPTSAAASAPRTDPDQDGECVGPYRLLRELGRGGMGVVYLAEQTHTGDQVALKMIRPDMPVSERDVQLFLREADVLRSLQHPNIIAFRDLGEDNGRLYFAAEFVPGINVAQWRQRQEAVSVRTITRMIDQVLQALNYAHEQRFVHRDVKPENILLTRLHGRSTVKVADFGLARVYETSRMSGITMQGQVGGSLAYAPPEYLTSYRDARPAGDLYSTAATMWTLLTGDRIYDFPPSMAQAVLKILQEDPIPLTRSHPAVPPAIHDVLRVALQRDPEQRFSSAAQMRQALRAARADVS